MSTRHSPGRWIGTVRFILTSQPLPTTNYVMTKATQPFEETIPAPSTELYPNLAAYAANGGSLKVKRDGRLWYVTVVRGGEKDYAVTMASSDLEYALRQCDTVCRSWVMA